MMCGFTRVVVSSSSVKHDSLIMTLTFNFTQFKKLCRFKLNYCYNSHKAFIDMINLNCLFERRDVLYSCTTQRNHCLGSIQEYYHVHIKYEKSLCDLPCTTSNLNALSHKCRLIRKLNGSININIGKTSAFCYYIKRFLNVQKQ